VFGRLLLTTAVTLASAEITRGVEMSTTLEYRAVAGFKAREIPGPARRLKISGLAMHSALFVGRIESKIDGPVETVLVHLTPIGSAGMSGNFDYDVDIPPSVNEVRFGTEGTVIWRRKSDD
jgi:hypothetical protein